MIYLASPLFDVVQKAKIQRVVNALRNAGYKVYSPVEHEVPHAWKLPNWLWAQEVFKEDLRNLENADVVVTIYEGLNSDSGTAWEIGYACAKDKPVYLITSKPNEIQSLMVMNSVNAVYGFEEFLQMIKKENKIIVEYENITPSFFPYQS